MQTTRGTSLSQEPGSSHPAPRRRAPAVVVLTVVAAAAYVLDQSTKWWAEHSLTEGQPRQLVGDVLRLSLSHNAGAAFSTGTSYTVALTLIALVVIVVCLRMARRLRSVGWGFALGLLLGGSLGNVTDRILRAPSPFRGHVVDFLQLPHWPVFNVADSSISVAAVLFVALSFRGVHLDGSVEQRPARADGVADSS